MLQEKARKYRAENKEHVKQLRRINRARHPEKVREYARKYKAKYRELIRERSRINQKRYKQRHREKLREQNRQYKIKHRESIRERDKLYQKRYRERHRERIRENRRKQDQTRQQITETIPNQSPETVASPSFLASALAEDISCRFNTDTDQENIAFLELAVTFM